MTPVALRLLLLAPFARDEDLGGSQRATALAERLEQRGVHVVWVTVERSTATRGRKLRAMARGEPTMVTLYPPSAAAHPDRFDVVLVAHSYLAGHARALAPGTPRIVDFHNLEWQQLADAHGLVGPGARTRAPLRAYRAAQVGLTRRFERLVVQEGDLSLFVSEPELEWALRHGPSEKAMLLRSVLPSAVEQTARETAARRVSAAERRGLIYVGSLRFPPNALSLLDFLQRVWPTVRSRSPGAELLVAGGCAEDLRAEINRYPGVVALGFVEDLGALLERSAGAVMPFGGRAGTSLRILFYGLAGIPVIGSPEAFRGFHPGMGIVATSATEWSEAVALLTGDPLGQETADLVQGAQNQVARLQDDPGPWDDLHMAITHMARGRTT